MVSAIAIIDGKGKEISAGDFEQIKKDIKNEIIQAFKKYNLTVGQTCNIISECEADIRNAMYGLLFSEHF